jgi:DNA-damage-inducible protein J
MKRASRIAEENGISDMTLEEINAEIAEARK